MTKCTYKFPKDKRPRTTQKDNLIPVLSLHRLGKRCTMIKFSSRRRVLEEHQAVQDCIQTNDSNKTNCRLLIRVTYELQRLFYNTSIGCFQNPFYNEQQEAEVTLVQDIVGKARSMRSDYNLTKQKIDSKSTV